MATLASLLISLGIDASGTHGEIEKTQKRLESLGGGMAKVGAAMTIGITGPLAAVGATALSIGSDFDSAMDTIRTSTGATGGALTALGDDMRAVFKQVPTTMDAAAQAVSDLNKRTGQTGQSLQTLAARTLELSDLTGDELTPLIEGTTRAFGDWGVAVEDQTGTLDLFYKVSQSTGIGVSDLANKLVQFGAPLRQMGFDLETSAALMGKWEKEGVNAELVLGSLRIALVKMSKEGVTDTNAALLELTRRIQEAGSVGEANALAIETFGARAGPDMAAAIREGRFEIAELLTSLQASGETIQKATQDTQDYGEKWQLAKNRIVDAAIPLGTQLFDAMNGLMPLFEQGIGLVTSLIERFTSLPQPVQQTILIILGLVAAAGPVMTVLGGMVSGVGAVSGAISGLAGVAGTAIPAIVGLLATPAAPIIALVAVVAGLALAWKNNWLGIRDITGQAVEGVKGFVGGMATGIVTTLTNLVSAAFDLGGSLLRRFGEGIANAASAVVDRVRSVVQGVRDLLPGSDAKVGPLSDLSKSGMALGVTFAEGMKKGERIVGREAVSLAEAARPTLSGSGAGGTRQLAGQEQVNQALLGSASARRAGFGQLTPTGGGGQEINVTINNPTGEPSEQSLVRELKNLNYLGVLNPGAA